MDKFTYGYGTTSNRLLNVADAAGATSNPDDIESGQVANNYQYDFLGQLISDNQEGILNYNWRLSDRKLRSITGAPTKADVNFIYNPFGQRVVKIVKPKVNGVVDKQSNWIYTYYSYDANGQVMAVYDCKLDPTNTTLNKATLKEQHLYGSQRLGMVNKNTNVYENNTANTAISSLVQNTYGNTKYELNNHLGNVNAVITDRRYWNTTTLKYEAVVEMKKDYYPFGMEMQGRTFNSDSYRFGYNGMELDNEVSGKGNSYTTEFRQYDPRLGRWKSLDPLMAQFPWQSPYCAFDNNPVFYNDPLGLAAKEGDDWVATTTKDENGVETQNWEWVNETYKSKQEALDAGKGYTDWMGKGGVVSDMKLTKNGETTYKGAVTLLDGGDYLKGDYSKNSGTVFPNSTSETSTTSGATESGKSSTSTSSASLENPWNKSGDNQSSGGLDGKDWFEIGLGTVSTFYDIKGNSLHNDLYWKGRTTGKIYTKNPFTSNKIGWKANSFKATGKTFQGAKSLGTKLGIVGMALTGADIIWGDGLTSSNILDATFGAAGFIPGIGWMISGSYFIINTGVQLYSGKSIGEHLDD